MGGDRLCVDVLGPLRACDPTGRDVTPEGPLQRRLLALLVLRRGHVVSVDAAIDALWPINPPRDPTAALHNHLFRLRRGLPDGLIESTGAGYRLEPSSIDLDADRLAAALTDGEGGDGAATIDAVLARWHGPAYPELDDVDDGRTEAIRLAELRSRAVEARAEARLAAGDTDGLVAELAALADEEPLRERPRSLLMDALARVGRTVEALRVYDDFRRNLGAELGIEPSPSMMAQHAALLSGTPVGTWSPASRLPVPTTSLLGRDDLVAEVTALAESHRLATLVGPGGVGKTRLLIEVAHRLRAADLDRPVVMCELATAGMESAVDGVASALVIDGRPGVPIVDRVAAVMADTRIVLLLDNCEHVLDPVAVLVERLLATCPHVTMIGTSRERLRVPGERLCTVPTLPTASVSSDDTTGPAVQLFVDRARAVAPGFEPDAAERRVIAEVVRRLDGLPLAIELAAARLHTHDVDEVAAGLDQRFGLLSAGYRTSSRHGSLSAAVSWSYGLLDEHLQEFFADLSVFAGPFDVVDAAAVCAVDVEAARLTLHQLAERSLVMRAPLGRFVLLETLRAFGAEQLAAAGRSEPTSERHARHQVAWAETADRHLLESGEGTSITQIDAAIPELRTALNWLLDHGRVELAGRLVASLLDYGIMRLRPDVLAWSERVTAADPHDRSPAAPVVLVAGAYAAWMAGDVPETGVRSRRALRASARTSGDVPAEVATSSGNFELFQGNLEEAARWYRQAVEVAVDDPAQRLVAAGAELLARAYASDPAVVDLAAELLEAVGDTGTPYAAYASFCAGEAHLPTDVERARACFDRALRIGEATHASFVVGVAGAARASIDARLGDACAAAEDYRRLITHWRRAGMWSTQWTMLRSIAGLLARLGRPREAAVLVGAIRATDAGHRIFGSDEATLAELGSRLRAELGQQVYEVAAREGAALDGDAAVDHALSALDEPS